MPNRFRRNSVVDMIARVPVNRGSLLKGIENLLKTIESSESAVMIPTLLRDKVRVDAWELLFVAKILKASILGHSDLVEFYMNHIGHASLQQQQQANGTPAGTPTTTGPAPVPASELGAASLSPLSAALKGQLHQQQQQQQSPMGSPLLVGQQTLPATQEQPPPPPPQQQGGDSPANSVSATSTAATSGGQLAATSTVSSRTNSTASWITANQQQTSFASSMASSHSSGASGASSSSSASTANGLAPTTDSPPPTTGVNGQQQQPAIDGPLASAAPIRLPAAADLSAMEAARPLLMRQAQPPSLLQLTTTNNHINSMASNYAATTNNSLDQLTNQLSSMQSGGGGCGGGQPQTNGLLNTTTTTTTNGSSNGPPTGGPNTNGTFSISGAGASTPAASSLNGLDGHLLSISTAANGHGGGGSGSNAADHHQIQQPTSRCPAELRSSRSAGCLFRANSGASSPNTRTPAQTPTTPAYPQAETLAANGQSNGLVGDPSAPVKLLLQIEQLKVSIVHVTTLLESVVELYKNSVDNIAQ